MPDSAAPAPSRQYGSAMALPRIHFIAFGGTISSTASVGGGPVTPTLGAAGIVATAAGGLVAAGLALLAARADLGVDLRACAPLVAWLAPRLP